MSHTAAIHEGFMNGSRTILPRVGVGVGGGVREGIGTAAYHLKVGASTGLWITRCRRVPRPRMQKAINRGGR